MDNIEYEIYILFEGKETYRRCHASFVQVLVNRFRDNLRIRPVGETIPHQYPIFYGFKPQKIRKNGAICRRRLQEAFDQNNMFSTEDLMQQ